jgi:hypothetical protein
MALLSILACSKRTPAPTQLILPTDRNDARLEELALAFRFFKRGLRVRILRRPPDSLQVRELFSDFARIRRFLGLFIDHAALKRALEYALEGTFSLFSLKGKLAVPFSRRRSGQGRS